MYEKGSKQVDAAGVYFPLYNDVKHIEQLIKLMFVMFFLQRYIFHWDVCDRVHNGMWGGSQSFCGGRLQRCVGHCCQNLPDGRRETEGGHSQRSAETQP